jgi:hypothetical protein
MKTPLWMSVFAPPLLTQFARQKENMLPADARSLKIDLAESPGPRHHEFATGAATDTM